MKREDKELLFKDLCARLPYNVIVHIHDLNVIDYDNYLYVETLAKFESNDVTLKPYLRSLSSITDEEMNTYTNTGSFLHANGIPYNLVYTTEGLLFLLNNHFDIFGLIPKGLAIEVTEENNPYNKQEE